jgi:hypothetical protein
MAKRPAHKRKFASRSTKPERFVKLDYYLLKSDAWTDLSHPARSLYVELKRRFNGINNGYLSFSVREAKKILKVSVNRAHAAFGELEAHGFIRARQKGSFNLKKRHATEWILTEHGFPEGAAPARDLMRWHLDTAEPPSRAVKKQNPVSKGKTDSTSQRDRRCPTGPLNGVFGTPDRDREAKIPAPNGLAERDTSNLPGREEARCATDRPEETVLFEDQEDDRVNGYRVGF